MIFMSGSLSAKAIMCQMGGSLDIGIRGVSFGLWISYFRNQDEPINVVQNYSSLAILL